MHVTRSIYFSLIFIYTYIDIYDQEIVRCQENKWNQGCKGTNTRIEKCETSVRSDKS